MTLSPKLQAALSLYTSNAASSPALGVSRDDFKASESHLLAVHRAEVLASLAGQTPEETLRQAVEACEGLRRAAGLQMNHIAGATIHVYLEAAVPILTAPLRAKNAALTEQLREADEGYDASLKLIDAECEKLESEVATLTARNATLAEQLREADRGNERLRDRIRSDDEKMLLWAQEDDENLAKLAAAEAREAALVAGIQNAADSLDTAAVEKVQLALRALLTKGAPHGD